MRARAPNETAAEHLRNALGILEHHARAHAIGSPLEADDVAAVEHRVRLALESLVMGPARAEVPLFGTLVPAQPRTPEELERVDRAVKAWEKSVRDNPPQRVTDFTTPPPDFEPARRRALEAINRQESSSNVTTRWYRRPGCFGAVPAVASVFFSLIARAEGWL